jgi:hypothetical protein
MTRAQIANELNALVKQRFLLGWSALLREDHGTGRYERRWLLNPVAGPSLHHTRVDIEAYLRMARHLNDLDRAA